MAYKAVFAGHDTVPMTQSANTDAARQKAKALSRWEGEGGSLGPSVAALDEEDMRILARLGAAFLIERDAIPEATQDAVHAMASTLHAQGDARRIQQAIARFFDEHKDR